ncbi:DNA alkylation repair protein [Candidatus Woesearchaeota archaeon]|nr:DNA alkylation repair protein [Candidatus Woesearchaeota archaeon]
MKNSVKDDLKLLANPEKAKILQGFFKTGKGQYGEGDIFLGISMPNQRTIAKKHKNTKLTTIQSLLNSKVHEHRMTALLILVDQYPNNQEQTFNLYIKNTRNINNWDLIDVTTPKIVGHYLIDKPRDLLYLFAKSKSLWERRIAILATFQFIKNNDFQDSLNLAEILLHDPHDLIHKAVGWMLREIGKRDLKTEEQFIKQYYKIMPRTMLRYAIERFPEKKRKMYMIKPNQKP